MMKAGLVPVAVLTLFFSPLPASAQQDHEDSIIYGKALDNTLAVYHNLEKDQSRLYNGKQYTGYPFNFVEGSPYLDSLFFRDGSVIYDGITYPGIPLLFDDLSQKLITKDLDFDLELVSERIAAFTIASHHFARFVADSLNRGPLKTGFYEVLYPGPTTVLKKLYKNILEDPTITEGILRTIQETTDYFIRTVCGYHKVNSKRELLDVLDDHKKEIQRVIRKSKFKYRKHKDEILLQVAAEYDQLKK
ncbi:MAG: hypothetical protein Q8926_02030 [Bacteroidota bacterium]|nr:hypothetical protein [Bacteroidota bacterium]